MAAPTRPRRVYGAAAWTGTRDLPARIEWILFSSADGSDRLDDSAAVAFQREIDRGAALVLGERVSRPDSRRRLTTTQRFGNALCCALIALGWARRFRDMASLRVVRREAFERLALRSRGFGWNVEMQVRAVEQGLRIAEDEVEVLHDRTIGKPAELRKQIAPKENISPDDPISGCRQQGGARQRHDPRGEHAENGFPFRLARRDTHAQQRADAHMRRAHG